MQIGSYYILVVMLILIISYCIFDLTKHRHTKAATELLAAHALLLFGLICFGLSLVVRQPEQKVFFNELKFITIPFLAVATLFMNIRFLEKDSWITVKNIVILSIVPCLTVIFCFTNHYHQWFREAIYVTDYQGMPYVYVESGSWYIFYTLYSYVLHTAGFVLLFLEYYKKPRLYRQQTTIMISSGLFAIVVNMLVALQLIEDYGDATLVGFTVTAFIQYYAIVLYTNKSVVQQSKDLAISHIKSPILIFDNKQILIDVNVAATELFGISQESELSIYDFIAKLQPRFVAANTSGLQTNDDLNNFEVYISESETYFVIFDKTIGDEQNRFIGRLLIFNNITKMRMKVERLEYITTHDFVTGLRNRHAFFSYSFQEFPVVVLCVQINQLNLCTEVFGTERGDQIIQSFATQFAHSLQENFSEKTKLTARISGGEFGIILEQTHPEEVRAFLQRFATGRQPETPYTGFDYGMSVLQNSSKTIETQYIIAQQNMQKAKEIRAVEEQEKTIDSILSLLKTDQHETILTLCLQTAKKLGLSEYELARLRLLCDVHDIGLLSLPQNITQNIGHLSNAEWEEYKLHAIKGYKIAETVAPLSGIAQEILCHHERYDGYGYPHRLSGDAIPILSAILLVVQDYVTSTLPTKDALQKVRSQAGQKYAPAVVEAFVQVWETLC